MDFPTFALAVDRRPGGHTVADGILAGVPVLEVGDPLVPVVRLKPAEVRAGDERNFSPDFQGGLKRPRRISNFVRGRATTVDQEYGHRPGAFRDEPIKLGDILHRADRQGDHQPGVIRDGRFLWLLGSRELEYQLLDPFGPPPLGELEVAARPGLGLAAEEFRGGDLFDVRHTVRKIVAPPDCNPQFLRFPWDEQAHPHRRREERLAGGGRLGGGLVVGAGSGSQFLAPFIARIVGLLGFVGVGRDEKAGHIPPGRGLGKHLGVKVCVIAVGANQIGAEGVDQLLSDVDGLHLCSPRE